MSFGGSILILTACVWLMFFYQSRLAGQGLVYDRRWLIGWLIKGLAAPIGLWISLNCGFPFPLATWWKEPTGGTWFSQKLALFAPGIAIAASYWGAVTLVWWVGAVLREAEDRRGFIVSTGIWGLLLSPFIAVLLYSWGLPGVGFVALVCMVATIHTTLLRLVKEPAKPLYSGAIAKIKFGKYAEAEEEVLAQLENCENDFDGWMMLAELYATHFHDLLEAERTILDLANDPKLTATHVSIAFHRLADWQLKLRENPVAARKSLAEIIKRFPGTHLAKMAQLRSDQLPASTEELREQSKGRTIKIHHMPDDLGLKEPQEIDKERAAALANQCVEKLKQNPNDVGAREELARIFAEQMNAIDLAMEQMELLVEMPDQPPQKVAEWLGLMAVWQRKYRSDPIAARKILERLIHEYPQSPQAFAAQRELYQIDMEQRLRNPQRVN
ncbi:MAG: hypothetical protein JWQ71_2320 [Pedosphaera sp.]|nr:hypothetical protein [Pedosphaera sp.]